MEPEALAELLSRVADGSVAVAEAAGRLQTAGFADLAYAKVDTDRSRRTGYPEAVYGAGKSAEQIIGIGRALRESGARILVTRVDPEKADAVRREVPGLQYDPTSRVLREPARGAGAGEISVVSAGTSDLPVAEEAAVTAEALGNRVTRVYDVGVAGIHRLFAQLDTIRRARVVIVVAGMEGALASVVGGLVNRPVIAVPTSVGYGSSLHGVAALLTMLNSCAAGISVVNIDNGFGAAYTAAMINRPSEGESE